MQSFIGKITKGKNFSDNDDELYLYLILCIAILFAGIMHILLFFLMLIAGVKLFVLLNGISVLIYGSLFLLLFKHRTYRLAGVCMTVEVIFHALFALIYMGENCYSFLYFFLLLLIQLNVPYGKRSLRVISSVVIFIALVGSVIVGLTVSPIYQFQNQAGLIIISVSNCILCFFGILIELLAFNIIRKNYDERVKKYENRAHTDSLTGIYNRWYADGFISSFSKKTEEKHWCVAMIDIDDFKKINDTMGHPIGDRVLQAFVNVLSSELRKTDVIFRWGGEEFLVFLSDVDVQTAVDILNKARNLIADTPVFVADIRVDYTVTIGVAAVNFNDVQSSIAICDERMYFGKQNGKNRVVF